MGSSRHRFAGEGMAERMARAGPVGSGLSAPRSVTGMREIILTFHGIGDPPAGTDAAELRYWWDESSFLLALDHISAAPSTVRLATHITFDDGNASDAKIALPGLTKRGLTASFFICAGRIRAPGYVDPTPSEIC